MHPDIALKLQLWLYYYGMPLLAVLGFCGIGIIGRQSRYGAKKATLLLSIVGLSFFSIFLPLPFEFYRIEREMFCKDSNPNPPPPAPSQFTSKNDRFSRSLQLHRARSVKVSSCALSARNRADEMRAISLGLLPFSLLLGLSALLVMRPVPGPERPSFSTFCFLGCAVIFIFWESLNLLGV